MSRIRAALVALVVSATGAGGLSVLTAVPASAGSFAPTLSCVPVGALETDCTVTDYDGIKFVNVKNKTTNAAELGVRFPCPGHEVTGQDDVDSYTFVIRVAANSKYKVFETDCTGAKSSWIVDGFSAAVTPVNINP